MKALIQPFIEPKPDSPKLSEYEALINDNGAIHLNVGRDCVEIFPDGEIKVIVNAVKEHDRPNVTCLHPFKGTVTLTFDGELRQ